jgi:hypothetical protein
MNSGKPCGDTAAKNNLAAAVRRSRRFSRQTFGGHFRARHGMLSRSAHAGSMRSIQAALAYVGIRPSDVEHAAIG